MLLLLLRRGDSFLELNRGRSDLRHRRRRRRLLLLLLLRLLMFMLLVGRGWALCRWAGTA